MQSNVPLLRKDLDFIPVEHEEQQFVAIRDHLGLARPGLALPLPLFRLLAQLQPESTLSDMQAIMAQQSQGQVLTMEQLRGMVQELDEAFLLESEGFAEARDRVMQEFVAGDSRPAVMAGQAYPDDPETLRNWLEATIIAGAKPEEKAGALRALVAPHIDPGIGASVYARAYAALEGAAPERVIVLGVGHQLDTGIFSCSDKQYQTPFGALATDAELATSLLSLRGGAAMAANGLPLMAPDDFAHRNEHSIEFQLLFLQHFLGQSSLPVLPLLCGSLLYGLPEYSRQAFQDFAGPLLEPLRQAIAEEGGRTLLVAGVDFSHIGPKFGHQKQALELEEETRAHDTALLECLCAGDAEGFWKESARVQDSYNVCGFSVLATLLEVLPQNVVNNGEQLGYELWHEQPTASAVSFAAAAFRE